MYIVIYVQVPGGALNTAMMMNMVPVLKDEIIITFESKLFCAYNGGGGGGNLLW